MKMPLLLTKGKNKSKFLKNQDDDESRKFTTVKTQRGAAALPGPPLQVRILTGSRDRVAAAMIG